jgi:hypothetical protein
MIARSFRLFFGGLLLICCTSLAGQTIAKSGPTSIHAAVSGKKVDVAIRTAKIERGSELFPNLETGATSVVVLTDLQIIVNGAKVFVPRSVFADLLDPRTASIRADKSDFLLTISGGDASESYFVSIFFDSAKVKLRRLYSSLIPDVPSQETTYRLTVLKDE